MLKIPSNLEILENAEILKIWGGIRNMEHAEGSFIRTFRLLTHGDE